MIGNRVNAISVVVTCFNLERYIKAAIESVLRQDWDGAVEIIVVDDCSIDGSTARVESMPGVKLLRTPSNAGVLLATVLGIRNASHDVVAFLDGDDLWRSDKLACIAEAFSRSEALGLLTHDLRYIDSNGQLLDRVSRPSQVVREDSGLGTQDRQVREGILEQGDYVWLGSAYAIRRSLVDAEGFCAFAERLPDPVNTYQDWPLAVWCASREGVAMGYISKKLFDYRLHQANHSGDARTPAKAIRNVGRTLNTLKAIEKIVRMHDSVSTRARRAILRKRKYYEYVLDLYEGRRLAAVRGFVTAQRYVWQGDVSPWKEYARFIGVELLGLAGFLRWLVR